MHYRYVRVNSMKHTHDSRTQRIAGMQDKISKFIDSGLGNSIINAKIFNAVVACYK